jgi:dihydroneopterin aldolase
VSADRIELRGIRVLGTHGVLAHERLAAQPFEVDLDVELDLAPAGLDDDLARTVDYGALVDDVVEIVAGPSKLLIETLAEQIATAVLARPGVRGVAVTVRKLRPPLAADVATAGVRIERSAAPVPLVHARHRGGTATP